MQDKRNTIRAQEIILEDDKRRPRAILGADVTGGTTLQFLEPQGAVRITLGITPENTARMCLAYGQGKGRIQLEANDEQNTVGIVLAGSTGKVQLVLGVSDNGSPVIGIEGGDGWVTLGATQPSANVSETREEVDWDSLFRRQVDP